MDREALVLLAIADNIRTRGRCAACGTGLSHRGPQARWCEECLAISDRIVRTAATLRWRHGVVKVSPCKDCGRMYRARRGPHLRCPKCQKVYQLAYDRKRCREYRLKKAAV